jgi:DNA-binding transcriptional MerR regulator
MREMFFSSGKLASLVGVSADTLRHYERKGVLARPRRGPNGYREYPAEALERLQLVRRALAVGFTLDELAGILQVRDRGGNPCAEVRELAALKLAEVETRLRELRQVRDELRATLQDWDTRLAGRSGGERAHLLEHLPNRPPSKSPPSPRTNLLSKAGKKERK